MRPEGPGNRLLFFMSDLLSSVPSARAGGTLIGESFTRFVNSIKRIGENL
jgi:hypothetical protein